MARQMLIIPEEFYSSLMQQRGAPSNLASMRPLDTHFAAAREEMERILNSTNLTQPQKLALYNLLFKRIKKIKNESIEKADAPPPLLPSSPPPPPSLPPPPPTSERSYSERIEPPSSELPSTTPRKRITKAQRESERKVRIKEVEKYLMDHRKQFGINDKGQVMRTKDKVIADSSVKEIADSLVRDPNRPAPSPAGTQALRARMTEEDKGFLSSINNVLFGKGIKVKKVLIFKPKLWPPMDNY